MELCGLRWAIWDWWINVLEVIGWRWLVVVVVGFVRRER